jgi:hypothetical protein
MLWHSKVLSVIVWRRSSSHLEEGMIRWLGEKWSRAAIPLLDVGCGMSTTTGLCGDIEEDSLF